MMIPSGLVQFDQHDYDSSDNVGFQFEDNNENRPEFENYCMNLVDEKLNDTSNTLDSSRSPRSSRLIIHSNTNLSAADLEAEEQYINDFEQAMFKDYEMLYRLTQAQSKCSPEHAVIVSESNDDSFMGNAKFLNNIRSEMSEIASISRDTFHKAPSDDYTSQDSLALLLLRQLQDNQSGHCFETEKSSNHGTYGWQVSKAPVMVMNLGQSNETFIDSFGRALLPQSTCPIFPELHYSNNSSDFHISRRRQRLDSLVSLTEDLDLLLPSSSFSIDTSDDGVFQLDL